MQELLADPISGRLKKKEKRLDLLFSGNLSLFIFLLFQGPILFFPLSFLYTCSLFTPASTNFNVLPI